MYIMTAEGWKPLVFRNVIPAPDQKHWDTEELRAGVEAFIKRLERDNLEYAQMRKPKLWERLKKVQALRDGAKTPGERAAAEAALDRMQQAGGNS